MSAHADGGAACTVLTWDTDFWGFPVGRLGGDALTSAVVREADAWCDRHHIRCLYHRTAGTEPATLALLADSGFRFVDVRVDLECAGLPETPPLPAPAAFRVRPATDADLPHLRAMAAGSHRDTRFLKDIRFNRDKARDLYARWLERDFREHHVLSCVDVDANAVCGYVTCQIEEPRARGRIGLIGVDERYRGRGVGRLLLSAALRWYSAAHVPAVRVATQATNVAALRLYEASSFRTREVGLWFHKWFDRPPPQSQDC